MFKKAIITTLISVSLLLSSCSNHKEENKQIDNSSLSHLPDWILNPNTEGTISAVGIAPKSKGGLQFQIPKAEADARANIASIISTEVSRLTKNSLREAQLENVSDVENVFSQATKNLVKKIPIAGARRTNMFRDAQDGTLYIMMSLDQEMLSEYFSKNRNYLDSALKSAQLSQERLNQSQKAVDSLYQELNEEINQ